MSGEEEQMRLAFLERHVEQQDQEIVGLRRVVERLEREMERLKAALEPDRLPEVPRNDRPPHH